MNQRGFTLIEILFVIVIFAVAGTVLLLQRNDLNASFRDSERKTAINAMHYSLEEVFYRENGYYPTTIDSEILPSVDPALFIDPDDNAINTAGSTYHYEGTACEGNECQSYRLSAELEREDEFVRTQRDRSEED